MTYDLRVCICGLVEQLDWIALHAAELSTQEQQSAGAVLQAQWLELQSREKEIVSAEVDSTIHIYMFISHFLFCRNPIMFAYSTRKEDRKENLIYLNFRSERLQLTDITWLKREHDAADDDLVACSVFHSWSSRRYAWQGLVFQIPSSR